MEAALNPNLNRHARRGGSPRPRTAGRAADKHADRRHAAGGDAGRATVPRRPCDLFQFWRACAHGQCRRARACSRDPAACFKQGWPRLPEEARAWFRAAITALSAGASPQAADAAGCEAALRCHAQAAPAARSCAVPNALSPTPAASALPNGAPRLRTPG
jgi:hypothetical protein